MTTKGDLVKTVRKLIAGLGIAVMTVTPAMHASAATQPVQYLDNAQTTMTSYDVQSVTQLQSEGFDTITVQPMAWTYAVLVFDSLHCADRNDEVATWTPLSNTSNDSVAWCGTGAV